MILKTKTQKGFSLLELLLVVAVGAILILAGLAIYRNITANTSVNDTSRMVNVLKQEVQRIYQGEASYAALDNDLLVDTQVVPDVSIDGNDVNVPTVANINAVCGDGVDMIWTFN